MDALQIASSIYDVAKDLYKYYQAWKDCDKDVAELRAQLLWLSNALLRLKEILTKDSLPDDGKKLIENAVRDCELASTELTEILSKIKTQDAGPQTALQKLRAQGRRAIYPFRKSTVMALAENVESCRDALHLSLSLLGLEVTADTLATLRELDWKLVQGFANVETAIDQLQEDQTSSFDRLRQYLDSQQNYFQVQQVMALLNYTDLDKRKETITSPGQGTYQWFLREDSDVSQWLRSGSGLWWVQGKAGSGKSTLMKFLATHNMTHDHLQRWAGGDKPVLVADHYFWVAGSSMQKSQDGLLRSLLKQMLMIDSTLLSLYCPELSNTQSTAVSIKDWTTEKLLSIFVEVCKTSGRFVCLFIDGLDEMQPEHDQQQFASMLCTLSQHANVKILVSSRPWPAFQAAFSNRSGGVSLEQCNQWDILEYTCTRLSKASNGRISAANTRDEVLNVLYHGETSHEGSKISDEHGYTCRLVLCVLTGADGVFLWASLVLDALCERLSAGHDVRRLLQHVDTFPKKLEDYFKNLIFDRIHDTWRSDTAICLVIMTIWADKRWPEPSFLFFWLLARDGGHFSALEPSRLLSMPFTEYTSSELNAMATETQACLAACCKGLVRIAFYRREDTEQFDLGRDATTTAEPRASTPLQSARLLVPAAGPYQVRGVWYTAELHLVSWHSQPAMAVYPFEDSSDELSAKDNVAYLASMPEQLVVELENAARILSERCGTEVLQSLARSEDSHYLFDVLSAMAIRGRNSFSGLILPYLSEHKLQRFRDAVSRRIQYLNPAVQNSWGAL